MKKKLLVPLIFILGLTILMLAACSGAGTELDQGAEDSDPNPTSSPNEAATSTASSQNSPSPTPLPGSDDETSSEADGGITINDDVERSIMFKVNTLAYELPGMDDVEVINVTYSDHDGQPLTMDVYYPPATEEGDRLPAVVFGLGYKMSEVPLRDAHFYTSWGKLVAAAGMIGISYDTEQPDQDLETLMAFIEEHTAELKVDLGRIGFHSTSANPPTVMSYLMQEGREGYKFAVYYYGSSLTPDRKYDEFFGEICARRGCLYSELADVSYVDPDMPLFIVKAGRDFVSSANEAMDHFIGYVRDQGAEVTEINYEEGRHSFDTEQKTEESAEIIAQTVDFMIANFGLDAESASDGDASQAQEEIAPLVLHNGTVVTVASDEAITDAVVVVENGLITAVGPEAEITIPEGAALIDVQGRTILPGLIDARTSVLKELQIADGQIDDIGLQVFLASALRGGITTVRDTGSQWGNTQDIAELRSALEEYGNSIPAVVLTGPSLAHPDGTAVDVYSEGTIGVGTIEAAGQTVESLIQAGVDQIAFIQSITQDSQNDSSAGLPPTLSQEQLEAIVQAAHNHDVWVAGQAVFADEAMMALAAGVDELANWPSRSVPMPEELLNALVSGSTPVVSGFNILPPQDGDVRRFLDAGGTLAFGTYAPNSGSLNDPYREFRVMSLNDMTPMEIIKAATINAAQTIGLGDLVGTLEPGKQADIVVVDGDPFEDFRVMRDVVYVVKGGELVVQPEDS